MTINDDNRMIGNAYDLVSRILSHPQGGVDALLGLAGDQETDWLEFKAALHPQGGIPKDGEKLDDYRWHVAKAAVALANSAGGAVILGLDDDMQAVGLAPSDPRGTLKTKGREPFNRETVQKALVCGQWKTGRSGTIRLEGSLDSLIEIRNADYQGHSLAVVLVAPVPDGELLEISELRDNRERCLIPVRARGAVGEVRDLLGRKEIRDHEQARANQLRGDTYDHLWQRFLSRLPAGEPTSTTPLLDATAESALIACSRAFATYHRRLRDIFTPLDLEETRQSDSDSERPHEFVPEAEEWRDLYDSDNPWDDAVADLNDDADYELNASSDNKAQPKPLRRGGVFDLLAQEPRAILLGEPGAGKSTCLQRLALEQADAYESGTALPLYVPLRAFTETGLKALLERHAKQPWPVLEALIRDNRLNVLLDAINECPRYLQERCCQEIQGLLDDYPNLPLILSARNLAYRCNAHLPVFVVRPLDQEQQHRFLTTYLHDAKRAAQLLKQLQSQPGGDLVASNPMLLSMVVEVSRAQGDLPQGRAQLYRRFFIDWYARENKKEKKTGAPLRWPFPRTLEALSHLAFASRKDGLVDLERIAAERILRPLLADDTAHFLKRMAQGLLLCLDEHSDTLSFSHESVQEYLAAEYLAHDPNAYADLLDCEEAAWRMPLVHVFEITDTLPESFVQAAWQREPLLVAVALRDEALLRRLPIADDWNPWLKGILHTLRGENCDQDSDFIAQNLIYPPVYPLPKQVSDLLESTAFWYAGLMHNMGEKRLARLRKLIVKREEPWLDLLPIACKANESWQSNLDSAHTAFIQYIGTNGIKRNLSALTLHEISYLRRKGFLRKSDINHKLRSNIINTANPRQLLIIAPRTWKSEIPKNLINDIKETVNSYHLPWLYRGLLNISELNKDIIFEWRKHHSEWIKIANPFQINILLTVGLIDYSDISENRKGIIIAEMNAEDATFLLSQGIISISDIPDLKRKQFVDQMTAENASRLVTHRIIQAEEIPEAKRQQLIEEMTAADATWLVGKRIIHATDISKVKRLQLIEKMNAENASKLVSCGIIQAGEIPEAKRQQLIEEMMGKDASRLVWQGIVQAEDIPQEKHQQLIERMTAKDASWLVRQGIVQADEISETKRQQLIDDMTAADAPWLVRQNIIRVTEIPEAKRQQLIDQMTANNAFQLISCGIILLEEIPEERRQIVLEDRNENIKNMLSVEIIALKNRIFSGAFNTKIAIKLISAGLVSLEEISDSDRQQLIDDITAENAQLLVRNKIICADEIPEEKRKKIIEDMNAEQCDWLVHHRVIRVDEIPETKCAQFLDEIDSYRARWLIGQGIISPNDIKDEKKELFIREMDSEDALWLLKQGVISLENIPETKRYQLAKAAINYAIPQANINDELTASIHQNDIRETSLDSFFGLIDVGVIKPSDVERSRLYSIIEKIDANKLAVLIRRHFLDPEMVPQSRIQCLIDQSGIGERMILSEIGLLKEKNLSENEREVGLEQETKDRYTKEEIQDESRRLVVENELKNVLWEMVVVHLNPDGSSGFASQPSFACNVFVLKDRLAFNSDDPLKKGDTLQAEVAVLYNRKRNEWNFVTKTGRRTQCAQYEVPGWWQAWQFFAPRWEMASEGQFDLRHETFDKLHKEGFDTERLSQWQPTEKEGRRIKQADYLVQRALRNPPVNDPEHKRRIAEQLAGDGVWSDLRRLAAAYLDGKQMLVKIKIASIKASSASKQFAPPPTTTTSERRLFPNQIRQLDNRRLLADLDQRASLTPTQVSIADFLDKTTELTLYLDEAWFVPGTTLQSNEGVIAGLLCKGGPNAAITGLPALESHSYLKPLKASGALERLWTCRDCLPVIFHLRLAAEEPANPYYDRLLQHAIRFLLGWLLPRPSQTIRLHVFPEAIAPAHPIGDQATEFYHGLLAGDATGRFARWNLVEVEWKVKTFGYTPYADLLAHLTLEHTDVNRALGAWAKFKQLPGYVLFSLELVPRLERLEHLETSANLSDVIDFVLETGNSPFGRLVVRDLASRLARRPDLQQRLLETLEDGYRDKVRDLRRLRQSFAAVRGLLPALPEAASPRMRLLWYLLALQDANHDGDPSRIRATAGEYIKERETLKQNERELCAEADLNLAVHYADRFAFGHAEVTVGEWIYDPLFAALSLRQQARLYSALGQYRAMQDDAPGADGFFLKALELFRQAPLTEAERARECEQTNIYRAINALDGSLRVVPQALDAVFGAITPALAEQFAADGLLENQYRHHLLLRALALRPEFDAARQAYLAARDRWQDGHSQHPWPSIHGYRGFLLWNQTDLDEEQINEAACTAFDRAIELATMDHQGPTVKLIGALWATVAACCYADSGYETRAEALLNLARCLPDAAPAIAILEAVLANPDASRIGEAFAALPFNYR